MKIIVASDNIFRRELSSFILSEAGYSVDEAPTQSALTLEEQGRKPDLLLLDDRLAERPGIEYIVRACEQANIPVLLLIANYRDALLSLGSLLTNHDCLTWPYEAEDLLRHVKAILHTPLIESTTPAQVRPAQSA